MRSNNLNLLFQIKYLLYLSDTTNWLNTPPTAARMTSYRLDAESSKLHFPEFQTASRSAYDLASSEHTGRIWRCENVKKYAQWDSSERTVAAAQRLLRSSPGGDYEAQSVQRCSGFVVWSRLLGRKPVLQGTLGIAPGSSLRACPCSPVDCAEVSLNSHSRFLSA